MSKLLMATWVATQLVSAPLLPLAGLAVSVLTFSTMAAANTTPQERAEQRQREAKGEAFALETKHTILFLVAATTGLLSMWMFPNVLIYVTLLSFAVGSLFGMLATLPQLMRKFGVRRQKAEKAGTAIACLLCATWFILRNSSVGWIFQNILGGFSITIMLSLYKPSTLATPVILLSAAFVYDVFFVFGTRYLTSTGESIMEAAATGAKMTVKESIPMLFRIPSGDGEAFLGFGDVVLPGILVTFLRETDAKLAQAYQKKLDKKQGIDSNNSRPSPFVGIGEEGSISSLWSLVSTGWRRQHPPLNTILSIGGSQVQDYTLSNKASWTYYTIAVVWFAIGLQLTFVAMMVSASGQPALLYLVPCMVLPVIYIAYRRGELSPIWYGWDNAESVEEDPCGIQQDSPLEQEHPLVDRTCNE